MYFCVRGKKEQYCAADAPFLEKLSKLTIWRKRDAGRIYWTIWPFYIHVEYWKGHFRVWRA